jgi:hypothetical protein
MGRPCACSFEALAGGGEALTSCNTCGNSMHQGCMSLWASSRRQRGAAVTCPLCRATVGGSGASAEEGGYANLAAFSSAHAGADTSLEALYGDRSVWVRAAQGGMSRRAAASLWRGMGH